MASASSPLPPTGVFEAPYNMRSNIEFATSLASEPDITGLNSNVLSQFKKRKITESIAGSVSSEALLPTLRPSDYFMEPSIEELASLELSDPGHCRQVPNFRVGRVGYGCVQFLGETDVRWLDLDQIVKFNRHEIVVYEDEQNKPVVGQGLNKPAIVTLIVQVRSQALQGKELGDVIKKLRSSIERQGAQFISFNPLNGEWKFLVQHFSRFGLTEDDEDDTIMGDATIVQHPAEIIDDEVTVVDEEKIVDMDGTLLPHSLPAHLGLDPVKMQEMRLLMFPTEDESEEFGGPFSNEKQSFSKEYVRSVRKIHRDSPPSVRKTPLALLEYNRDVSDASPPGSILMTWKNKGMPTKRAKVEGFRIDLESETPVASSHSRNVVDAALFMGRSFRVGWGPNGVLVHTGTPVGKTDHWKGLSSIINVEKVAIDKVVRDEDNKVKEELIDLCFVSPLSLHKSISHRMTKVEIGSFRLELQNLVMDRFSLPEICRDYIEIVERQLDVPGLAISARTFLMHQVMVWELIKVLFSDMALSGHAKPVAVDDREEMMQEKEGSPDTDLEALPLVRRAHFSYWLQESVCHRVQGEVSCLNESNDLEHIFLLLTGRQLNAAVEMAASRGDVRLGCLLSQAGGSMVNRSDVARQLELWKVNGLDFNFIENDRLRLYELLAGNIQGALTDLKIDWKRFLGLLMWYELPPDTSLPVLVDAYQKLLGEERAPYPVPVYIDEGPLEESVNWSPGDRFDIAYYLMLLHANEKGYDTLKTMFSAFSSTHDALDYHMIWHQRAILEAVGAFSSNDLHILDMSLVSQLLCLEQCHWAIYVVLHMPYRDDFPYLQASVIREILFQYCEIWSTQETQRQFIEDLGIPSAWMHEAMAVYFHYHMDLPKALEHFLESCNWQRAHSIFMTSVAHSLFLSTKHSEIWRLANSMEEHQAEIADWDLGAGLYISFYHLRSSLQDENAMTDLDSLERKNVACKEFFGRLNESLEVWGNKLHIDARATYSKMAEEICCLLLSSGEESSSCDVQLSSFDTIIHAPLPEDLRSCRLQEAVSLFTFFLSETGSEL